jgi:hypothetical protein
MRELAFEKNFREILLFENISKDVPQKLLDDQLGRFHKYQADIQAELRDYYVWMDRRLSYVNVDEISDSFLEKTLPMAAIGGRRQQRIGKTFMGEYMAEAIEFASFLSDKMEGYLSLIHETLISTDFTIDEKRDRLDKYFFLYDINRLCAYDFNEGIIPEIVKENIVYKDNLGNEIKSYNAFERLETLSFPYDLRTYEMFFSLFRVLGDYSKLLWGVYYIFCYLVKLFETCGIHAFNNHNIKLTEIKPKRVWSEPDLKQVLEVITQRIGKQVKKLDSDIAPFESELLKNEEYKKLDNLDFFQLREMGLGKYAERTYSYDVVKNRMYALSYSIAPLDLLIDILYYMLKTNDENIAHEIEWYRNTYSNLKRYRQEILTMTLKNDYIYDEVRDEFSLSTIIRNEKEAEEKIQAQLKVCDDFNSIIELVDSESIDELMKKKKDLSVIMARNAGYSMYIIDKMSKSMEVLVESIEKKISREGLNKKYIDEIESILVCNPNLSQFALKEFKTMLASAEYLFQIYVEDKPEQKDLDYSFVALMYYTSLENLLNMCICRPYSEKIISEVGARLSEKNFSRYFPDESYKYLIGNDKRLIKTCEMGKIGRILSAEYPAKMEMFIKSNLKIGDTGLLKQYGKKVCDVARKRNDAAHGTTVVMYTDAIDAKESIFSTDNDIDQQIRNYRGMIIELSELLKGK